MTRRSNNESGDALPVETQVQQARPPPEKQHSRTTSWRQGDILADDAAEAFHPWPEDRRGDTLLLVVSHSCDILQPPDSEPSVELMVARPVSKVDGNLSRGKNPRCLHLRAGDQVVELRATERLFVPKADLISYSPNPQIRLSPGAINELQFWLAARYRRSAFPDASDHRLRKAGLAEKMRAILKRTSDTILAVYFRLDEGGVCEHADDDPYLLDIVLMYQAGDNPDTAATVADQARADIEKAFGTTCWDDTQHRWQFLELNSCQIVSDENMTHAESGRLQRWSQENISYRTSPPGPMVQDD